MLNEQAGEMCQAKGYSAVEAEENRVSLTPQQQQAAKTIEGCYQTLGNSNVVFPLLSTTDQLPYWQHQPKGDVRDPAHFTQYYYHAHPSNDDERVQEHGHFHLFFMPKAIPYGTDFIIANDHYHESLGKKENLTHLIAISMNEQGRPIALFTVNHWVVPGVWYSAEVLISMLDQFKVEHESAPWAITSQWLTAMVQLFNPYIAELLLQRDKVIAEYAQQHPESHVYYDKALEVTSVLSLI
ncbi:MAG: hypothetical protein KIT27_04490 [Legionellales bacterium]|nr:hypothetical protein [Legionellales bacterium]